MQTSAIAMADQGEEKVKVEPMAPTEPTRTPTPIGAGPSEGMSLEARLRLAATVPAFSGSPNTMGLEEWVERVEELQRRYCWTPTETASMVKGALKDRAFWLISSVDTRKESSATWSDIKSVLQKRFTLEVRSFEELMKDMEGLRQRAQEDPGAFMDRCQKVCDFAIRKIAKRLPSRFEEPSKEAVLKHQVVTAAITRFVMGLRPEVKSRVWMGLPKENSAECTIDGYIRAAVEATVGENANVTGVSALAVTEVSAIMMCTHQEMDFNCASCNISYVRNIQRSGRFRNQQQGRQGQIGGQWYQGQNQNRQGNGSQRGQQQQRRTGQQQNQAQQQQQGDQVRKCFYCGFPGHIARNCNKKKADQGKRQMQSVTQEGGPTETSLNVNDMDLFTGLGQSGNY